MYKKLLLLWVIIAVACWLPGQVKDTDSRTLAPRAFANLGTPANGTTVYCSDCTAANPTASGGSGVIVRRENGAWNGGGGSGGAPATAQYLTLTTDGTLTAERVFTPGTCMSGVDAGAGSTYTLNITATCAGYAALTSNSFGVSNAFTPSATTESVRLVPTTRPSAPNAGALNVDTSGDLEVWNSTRWNKGAVKVAVGTKALATSAISSAACSTAQTATATGTVTTDVISATFNGDPTAVTGYVPLTTGMLTIIAYPTADTVNFKVCNNTSSSITPGAITLNWIVTR